MTATVHEHVRSRTLGPIVDTNIMVYLEPGGPINVMPREAFRDDMNLDIWPSLGAVEYLFGDAKASMEASTRIDSTLALMDAQNIHSGQVFVLGDTPEDVLEQLAAEPRIFATLELLPHEGMRAVRTLVSMKERYPSLIRSAKVTPHHHYPQAPPNSKEYYPIYAKCVELDLPVCIPVGIPGPLVPSSTQDPSFVDEICWFFPDLKIVMKHGGEPWEEMCVKLMLKWPNLFFMTSGFAPKYYPRAIIDYANTRGADKVMFGGFFPVISFEKVIGQLQELPLRDHVWPKFLRENAVRIFGLPALP